MKRSVCPDPVTASITAPHNSLCRRRKSKLAPPFARHLPFQHVQDDAAAQKHREYRVPRSASPTHRCRYRRRSRPRPRPRAPDARPGDEAPWGPGSARIRDHKTPTKRGAITTLKGASVPDAHHLAVQQVADPRVVNGEKHHVNSDSGHRRAAAGLHRTFGAPSTPYGRALARAASQFDQPVRPVEHGQAKRRDEVDVAPGEVRLIRHRSGQRMDEHVCHRTSPATES